MLVGDFDFELPAELIAQEPVEESSDARLFHLPRADSARPASKPPSPHRHIADLPDILQKGDLVVVNDTRVFPARLLGRRDPSGGAVECLLLSRLSETAEEAPEERWEALVHPGQKLKPGARINFGGPSSLQAEVLESRFYGRRVIRLWTGNGASVAAAIDAIGHVPLPPYIKRTDRENDRHRYQTVFARHRGSVAAPTAGLHFSESLIGALHRRGVEIASITLHVGYGTFQPVRVERVEDHRLEPEPYSIADQSAIAINRALDEGRRVVAVGTTTTRTLEAVGRQHGGRLVSGAGSTDLFIYPPFGFTVVGGLLTNFHLPRSSLLMLVCAFAGRDRVLAAYRTAVAERYRFYSYGDAMLILNG
jgi:S-adenosylmethionine:tRNA ribosyltransferase-isomerase